MWNLVERVFGCCRGKYRGDGGRVVWSMREEDIEKLLEK